MISAFFAQEIPVREVGSGGNFLLLQTEAGAEKIFQFDATEKAIYTIAFFAVGDEKLFYDDFSFEDAGISIGIFDAKNRLLGKIAESGAYQLWFKNDGYGKSSIKIRAEKENGKFVSVKIEKKSVAEISVNESLSRDKNDYTTFFMESNAEKNFQLETSSRYEYYLIFYDAENYPYFFAESEKPGVANLIGWEGDGSATYFQRNSSNRARNVFRFRPEADGLFRLSVFSEKKSGGYFSFYVYRAERGKKYTVIEPSTNPKIYSANLNGKESADFGANLKGGTEYTIRFANSQNRKNSGAEKKYSMAMISVYNENGDWIFFDDGTQYEQKFVPNRDGFYKFSVSAYSKSAADGKFEFSLACK